MSASPYLYKKDVGSSHQVIISWLSLAEPGTRILDIGTATGVIGRELAGRGLVFTGIEPNQEWADRASQFYHSMIVSSVEDAIRCNPDALSGHKYVIFADVLEHLLDPEKILKMISELQPNDCEFIISLPNIANIWVRIHLLFGKFDYQDRGILDRTHLHFYTYKSMSSLLKAANLDIEKVWVTSIPLSLIHPFFDENRIGRLFQTIAYQITKIFPKLFAYQFVVIGKKIPL